MKPRTAVANAILDHLDDLDTDELVANARDFKRNGKKLTSKERDRITAVLDHYKSAIRNTLGTVPFGGDTAEVEGVSPAKPSTATEADVDATAGEQSSMNAGAEDFGMAIGQLFGDGGAPSHVVINVSNLTINHTPA